MNDNNKGNNQTQMEDLDIDTSDDDSLVGPTPGKSGSSADDLGEEAGLEPLEDEKGNPRPLTDEPVAADDTDETEAEE